jgi:cation channel sperm-associated protein 2
MITLRIGLQTEFEHDKLPELYLINLILQIFKNGLQIEPDIRSLRFTARRSRWPPLGIWARWLLNTTGFSIIMVATIFLNSALMAVDQGFYSNISVLCNSSHYFKNVGLSSDYEEERDILEIVDFLFLCIFLAEIGLKWLDNFGHFWNDGWNIFDFIITSTVGS